jgi:hypothetical protein
MNKRLYVIVRKDLSESYRSVQAGHAVAEWVLHDRTWQNETLIYLGVKTRKNFYVGQINYILWVLNILDLMNQILIMS